MRNDIESKIRVAISIIRKNQNKIGQKGNRIHERAMGENALRLSVLNGDVCVNCEHFKIDFYRRDGKDRVSLECAQKKMPWQLYEKVKLSEQPNCNTFKKHS